MIWFRKYSQAGVVFLLSFVANLAAEKNVPVLFWETNSSNSTKILPPGLSKLSTLDLVRIFDERLLTYNKLPLVLVFAEDKLRVEDFSRKDESGRGVFLRLAELSKQCGNSIFLPSVLEPISGLKQVLIQRGFNVQTLSLGVKSFQNPIKESDQTTDLATNTTILDTSIEISPNLDVNPNSFPNQNIDEESRIQSLERNLETTAGEDPVSESVSQLNNLPKPKKGSNEMSAPKAFLFRLSAETMPRHEETRTALLRKHDDEIAKAFAEFSSTQSNTIGVYTAFSTANFFVETTLGRGRRQDQPPDPPPMTPGLPVWGDETTTILFYFHKTFPLYENFESKVKDVVTASGMSSETKEEFLRLVVNGKAGATEVNLALCFKSTSSSWELVKVQVLGEGDKATDLLPTVTKVIVGRQYSYTCRGDIVFTDGKTRFTMSNFQMQAYMHSFRFSKAQDCVTFFTVGIWCGVVVGFIMTVVLSWALTMIMNIKINDKMDDPKGKALHVGAGSDI